ncbi:MAG: orotidine-5'-phosphate decarboxylase [Bacteroidota bacterium]
MNFSQRLRNAQDRSGSLLCIGLDPDERLLPPGLRGRRNPAAAFNRLIVEATEDLVCAYKLNLAFYEAMGAGGRRALEETLAAIPSRVITIGDGKRGDIGNSSELYARALFKDLGFDACTVNPYMGRDSVEPFTADERRGAFLLAATSNPGAGDFQNLRVRGRPLYEEVIRRAVQWNTRGNIGFVVGATQPAALARACALAPGAPLLIPGIGAQGGDLPGAVRSGCDAEGRMAVLNAGRSVLYASAGRDFAEAAREAALDLHRTIGSLLPPRGDRAR